MQVGKVRAGVVVAAITMALAGCTELTPTGTIPTTSAAASSPSADGTSAGSSSAVPSSSAAATQTYTPEEQAVIDQYKGYYEAFYKMPNLDEQSIRNAFSPYAIPEVVDQVVSGLRSKYAENQQHPTGSVTYGSIAVVVNGNFATALECRDGSTELVVSDIDGSIVGQGKPSTLYETTLLREAGAAWLVGKSQTMLQAC